MQSDGNRSITSSSPTPPRAAQAARLSAEALVLRYALFAVIATLVNLGAQRAIFAMMTGDFRLPAALGIGTAAGLVTKYLLDKKWIFFDRARPIAEEGRTFTLYTLTGVGTTAIFWGSESLFWWAGGTRTAREIGAILGLTAGYVLKYRLDRRFVFTDAA